MSWLSKISKGLKKIKKAVSSDKLGTLLNNPLVQGFVPGASALSQLQKGASMFDPTNMGETVPPTNATAAVAEQVERQGETLPPATSGPGHPIYMANQAIYGNPAARAAVAAIGLSPSSPEGQHRRALLFQRAMNSLSSQYAQGQQYNAQGQQTQYAPGSQLPVRHERSTNMYIGQPTGGMQRTPLMPTRYQGHPGFAPQAQNYGYTVGPAPMQRRFGQPYQSDPQPVERYEQVFDQVKRIVDIEYVDRIPTPEGGQAYGHIDYGVFPYKVRIDKNVPRGRQLVTLVHEMIHAVSKLRKLGLDEFQVHTLAIAFLSDVMPVLKAQGVLGAVK